MNSRCSISEKDKIIIKKQIKSDCVASGEVALRCSSGYPQLISMKPSGDPLSAVIDKSDSIIYTAMADLIWLTCPHLNDRIHRLENMGYIKKIEDLLESSRDMGEAVNYSHLNFFYLRKITYSALLSENYDNQRLMKIFHSGVGGRRRESGLKCLHVHFAHYLLNGQNIAGYITARLIREPFECRTGKCAYTFK